MDKVNVTCKQRVKWSMCGGPPGTSTWLESWRADPGGRRHEPVFRQQEALAPT